MVKHGVNIDRTVVLDHGTLSLCSGRIHPFRENSGERETGPLLCFGSKAIGSLSMRSRTASPVTGLHGTYEAGRGRLPGHATLPGEPLSASPCVIPDDAHYNPAGYSYLH